MISKENTNATAFKRFMQELLTKLASTDVNVNRGSIFFTRWRRDPHHLVHLSFLRRVGNKSAQQPQLEPRVKFCLDIHQASQEPNSFDDLQRPSVLCLTWLTLCQQKSSERPQVRFLTEESLVFKTFSE